MIGFALRQVELGEDAPYVLFDRALGHEDPSSNARIRSTLGHQGQHFALAGRQRIEWIASPTSSDKLLHQGWVHHRSTRDDRPDGADEFSNIGHPAFQELAQAFAAGQQLHGLIHFDVRGEEDDGGVG